MRLELSTEISDKLRTESESDLGPSIQIADVITVTTLEQHAKQIFGIAELSPATTLSGLAMRWAQSTGQSLSWVKDIEAQIRRAAQGEIPAVRWGYVREVRGPARYAPLVTRVRRVPGLGVQQFDVNLLPYNDLAAIPVTARMIPMNMIAGHFIDDTPLSSTKVRELLRRFQTQKRNRMPFIDSQSRVHMIVHRSMIDQYVSRKFIEADPAIDLANLTMADLLSTEPNLKSLFETSFAFVGKDQRLTDVKRLMSSKVHDVFVTETGLADEPVLGWITNAMMTQDT
jgi:hypothetical protein